MTVATAIDPYLDEIRALCKSFGVTRLAVFGSALRASFGADSSDVDLVVSFAKPLDMSRADQFFGLKEALESLFGRSVDLVVLDAVQNRFFREELERTQREVYAA